MHKNAGLRMQQRDDRHVRHFQIGVVGVSIATAIRALRHDYSTLYREYATPGTNDRAIQVRVCPKTFVPWRRRRCDIRVNDRLQFEPARSDELLPYVEWAINWEIPNAFPQYLQLHASSMAVGGAGVVFPGDSGSGKSTLTAGLLTRGWSYLCDEFALIHSDTLELHPYPRAICVKQPSFPVMESIGLSLFGRPCYSKGFKGFVRFVNPTDVRADAIGGVCPIRHVIFPRYTAGAQPVLIGMRRAEAAFELHRVCFNLFGCERLGLDVIAEMIRGAECFRLIAGEIRRTCDAVQELVEGGSCRNVKTA